MLARIIRTASLTVLLTALPTIAATDPSLEPLATCRESWIDWQKANDPQLAPFGEYLRSHFTYKDREPYLLPKAPVSLAGFHVLQVFPESVGMGVGFSVMIDATFEKAKKVFETKLGKPLEHCETGEGMKSCEHGVAEKRTFMLMASDKPGDRKTLVGCYYYYAK